MIWYTYMYCEIITTESLNNVQHIAKLQIFLFLVIKNLGIYSFNNFKINTIVLLARLGLQLYITGFIYSTTGDLYILTTLTHCQMTSDYIYIYIFFFPLYKNLFVF